MENLTDIFSFVSGTEQEQEKQKSEIRKYCDIEYPPLNLEIFSDWDEIQHQINSQVYSIVITDIKVLSKIKSEIAERLYFFLYQCHIRVEILNEKQSELLENRQPKNRISFTKGQITFPVLDIINNRFYAGLIEYVDKILNDEKKEG